MDGMVPWPHPPLGRSEVSAVQRRQKPRGSWMARDLERLPDPMESRDARMLLLLHPRLIRPPASGRPSGGG